jgi:alkane 1-monooxygenase
MSAFVSFFEQLLPAKRIDVFGKDSLMSSPLPYYILPLLLLYASYAVWDNAWSLMFIAYTLLPFLDDVFSYDLRNPTE